MPTDPPGTSAGANGSERTAPRAVSCRGERFDLYLDRQRIRRRVDEMGAAISNDYAGTTPILIGVLNGSFIFLADLMRSITIECEVDFWKLSSYGAEKVSSGDVTELKKLDAELSGRHVVVVEDIIDTGLSIDYVVQRIRAYGPASLRVATLLHKPDATASDVELNYVGFSIPDRFVIGYGLDFGQLGRNLPEIYIQPSEQASGEG